ncbi:MAG: hypothetical protein H0W08_09085 [Acidobacteria bacterium]|nr:hypothetical protein [Acidobacteriota bacterium]
MNAEATPEDVAWTFHPDHAAWADAGVLTSEAARRWIHAGGTPEDALEWRVLSDPVWIAADSAQPPSDITSIPVYLAIIQPFAAGRRNDPAAVVTTESTAAAARQSLCRAATRRMGQMSTGYGPLDAVRCYGAQDRMHFGSDATAGINAHDIGTTQASGSVTVVTIYDYGLVTHIADTDESAQEWLERYVARRWEDWGDAAHRDSLEAFFHAVNGRYTFTPCTISELPC